MTATDGPDKPNLWHLAERLSAENNRLRACLKECADDLAEYVEREYYGIREKYPSEERRYKRAMAPVLEARKLLLGA